MYRRIRALANPIHKQKEIGMKKSTSAFAVAAALLFSTAAFAQQPAGDSAAPNMSTTPDGVTPTPDASVPSGPSDTTTKHKKHAKKKHHRSSRSMKNSGSDTNSSQSPVMQTTPDGVTPTPDASTTQ